jgi:hypothetical protein
MSQNNKNNTPGMEQMKDAFDLLVRYEHEMNKNEDGEDIVDIREEWDDGLHGVKAQLKERAEERDTATAMIKNDDSDDEAELLDILDALPVDAGRDGFVSSKEGAFAGFAKGFLQEKLGRKTSDSLPKPSSAHTGDDCLLRDVKERSGAFTEKSILKKESSTGQKPLSRFKQRHMNMST